MVLKGVSSVNLREVVLTDSYHVATLDHDAPRIFAGTVTFIEELTS
jgi:carboxylesterase